MYAQEKQHGALRAVAELDQHKLRMEKLESIDLKVVDATVEKHPNDPIVICFKQLVQELVDDKAKLRKTARRLATCQEMIILLAETEEYL